MDRLKKYVKLPPKRLLAVYGAAGAVLLVGFVALYFTVGKSLTGFISDTAGFKAYLEGYKSLGAVIFVLIRAFQTVIKIIPAEPLEIASGYAFGTVGGMLLCSLGSLLGSIVIFILSKTVGAKFIFSFINEEEFNKLQLISNRKNQTLFLIIFYLIPGTPKDILTYIYATTKCSTLRFFVITTICRLPSILTSTICGSQLEKHNIELAVIIFAATAVVSIISTILYKQYERKKGN